MLVLGAMIVGSFVALIAVVINSIRLQNYVLRQAEKRREQPWNWD